MNRKWLVSALVAALGASCSTPTDTFPIPGNLDRPVDVTFACYGNMRVLTSDPDGLETDQVINTAQPAAACEAWSPKIDPVLDQPALKPVRGQGTVGGSKVAIPNWYGFILQSASGTVALARWLAKPSYSPDPNAGSTGMFAGGDIEVLDADPLTPGKNAISIGEEPIAIATDRSGCYEVTANAGSCDLSVLDINSAVDGDPSTPVRVERRVVRSSSGPILSRPAAMVAEPNTPDVGKVCPATADGKMYVAYPSCHLVAAVDLTSGMIVAGIKYDGDVPHLLTPAELDNPMCPDECSTGTSKLGSATPGALPVALDLEAAPDLASGAMPPANTMRLAIGALHAAKVTLVDLDPTTSQPLPQPPAQFALEDTRGTLGVTAVALSPQIPMGNPPDPDNPTNPGNPPAGGWGQYVYAVATDGTVRVVDVLNVDKECDTQVDTRFLRDPALDVSKLQCFPVGDPANPPRRVGARGPGIELIGDGVPTSVAIVKGLDRPLQTVDRSGELTDLAVTPATLVGYFAIITASNGRAFVVNVDDDRAPDRYVRMDPLSTTPVLVMAHQLRDSFSNRGALATKSVTFYKPDGSEDHQHDEATCALNDPEAAAGGTTGGGPRVADAPVALTTGGPIAASKVPELPTLRQRVCMGFDGAGNAAQSSTPSSSVISELQFAAPQEVRDQVFPDLRSLTSDELWTLTWEGALSQDTAIDGPLVRTAKMVVDTTGMHLLEPARPFCTMGVEPFDVVNFRGCNPMNGNADCPSGYRCFVHPDSKVTFGSCMLSNEAPRLATACRDYLTSIRHYTVGVAKSGDLVLLPRMHELRTTPIDGCSDQPDALGHSLQCTYLANYAAQNASDKNPSENPVVKPVPDADGVLRDVNNHTWACRADNTRAPINADPAQNKRCVETCTTTADCDVGTVCQGGVCMEGITPPQACVNGPQRFEVHAGEAFTVIGSRSGYIHPIGDQGDADHTCGRGPMASSLQLGRIPLKAPACDPTADPITGKLPGGGFEANPCSLTVSQAELQPNYKAGTCNLADPNNPTTIVEHPAPAIQFRNPGMKLTLVDPYYPGDQTCVRDGQGVVLDGQPPARIPLVFPGYSLSFEQKAGFTPLTLPLIAPAFPVKVVRGPTDSIWVIDNGDVLSSATGVPTRGQVFRIESTSLVVNALQ